MTGFSRYGITVPLEVSLPEHRRLYQELVDLGYTDVWSAEVDGTDGFTPLALAAAWTEQLRLGVAVVPAYTRGPALLAQSAAALAEAAPGRFALGLGTSSDVVVQRWNGIPFEDPYHRVQDTVRFLRAALGGEKVDFTGTTFSVKGFRLARPVSEPPPIYVAALRSQMLRLAGREADGVVLNWLSAEDVSTVLPHLGDRHDPPEVVARIFVCPTEDEDLARMVGRRMVAAYLNVTAYAEFQRWLGRGDQLSGMWEAWRAGDRKAALSEIPDQVVDDLLVHGSPAACKAHIARYVDHGITVPVIGLVAVGMDLATAVRELAPT